MKRILILFCFAATLCAQGRYTATTGDVTLSGAGTKLTVQQPAASSQTLQLENAVVYCSVACDVDQSRGGTAATATAGTVRTISGSSATATAWTASNVGTGTPTAGTIHIPAGATVVLDLSKITIPKGGTAANYTVIVGSITGNANITLYWSEQ